MRILFLSQVLPYPLDAGPKMRSYYTLRHLAQTHQVTLLTFVRDTDRSEYIAHLAEFCHAVHPVPMRRKRLRDAKFLFQSFFSRQPFIIIRDQVPEMNAKIAQLVRSESFDIVHVDQLWMAQYGLEAKKHDPSLKTILDQHNAVHLIPQRLAKDSTNPIKQHILGREADLLKHYEADVCSRFDHVVWVTEEDRQAVGNLPEAASVKPVPSTVIPICADPSQTEPVSRGHTKKRITFLGGLHWPPNAEGVVWFAKQVFPQIKQEVPDALLTVVGKSPPAGLEGEGVEVTGYVSDLQPYLAETAAFIVPLHAGGGMRVKILDAWSWGLPMVSTTIGAEGIETRHNQDILIADTAPAFAQEVVRLLTEPEFGRQMAQNGRQAVMEKYNWRVIYQAWDTVYQSLFHQNSIMSGEKVNGVTH